MIIRRYRAGDARAAGRLVADTYSAFNLAHASPEERGRLLGPFRQARSRDPKHRTAIAEAIRSEVVYVAEEEGTIVGVLRGRTGVLASLFVHGECHRRGIGRLLVARFESLCRRRGAAAIRVASTLFAVPFYQALGFVRTTGVRPCRSFEGTDLTYQPMKKSLS